MIERIPENVMDIILRSLSFKDLSNFQNAFKHNVRLNFFKYENHLLKRNIYCITFMKYGSRDQLYIRAKNKDEVIKHLADNYVSYRYLFKLYLDIIDGNLIMKNIDTGQIFIVSPYEELEIRRKYGNNLVDYRIDNILDEDIIKYLIYLLHCNITIEEINIIDV